MGRFYFIFMMQTQYRQYIAFMSTSLQIKGKLSECQSDRRKRGGKREFIPATSFFITVIGVRQRKKENKMKKRKGKSKQKDSQQKPK